MKHLTAAACLALTGLLATDLHAADAKGAPKKTAVKAATRIDWTFAVSNKSLAKPPSDWLGDYDSTQTQYDLYVPTGTKPKQGLPLILFINAGDGPAGWNNFEAICKDKGFLFASPYKAGNNVAGKKRIRMVLDVLDDIRRRYKVDPDRTYISGFSGGARMACIIAYRLPEFFGGVIPCCAVDNLPAAPGQDQREENWLRHRIRDRLSLALITGENDFNNCEVVRLWGPVITDFGVRCKIWNYPKMGHAVPGGKELTEVVAWLEEDVKRRRELGQAFPAARADDNLNSREEWSKALLAEGKKRAADPEQMYPGVMQLLGVMVRFDGTPAAAEAKKLLLEYDAKQEKPWELKEINEMRRGILSHARAFTAYAAGPLPKAYENERVPRAKQALELWQFIQKDGRGTKAAAEAEKRIPEVQKIIGGK